MNGPRPKDVEDTAIGERHIDLDVVRLPLISHRLDADPWQSDLETVVPDPRVDGFPHFGFRRLLGEDELECFAQPPGQINSHRPLPACRSLGRVDPLPDHSASQDAYST